MWIILISTRAFCLPLKSVPDAACTIDASDPRRPPHNVRQPWRRRALRFGLHNAELNMSGDISSAEKICNQNKSPFLSMTRDRSGYCPPL